MHYSNQRSVFNLFFFNALSDAWFSLNPVTSQKAVHPLAFALNCAVRGRAHDRGLINSAPRGPFHRQTPLEEEAGRLLGPPPPFSVSVACSAPGYRTMSCASTLLRFEALLQIMAHRQLALCSKGGLMSRPRCQAHEHPGSQRGWSLIRSRPEERQDLGRFFQTNSHLTKIGWQLPIRAF